MFTIGFIGPGSMGGVHLNALKTLKGQGYDIDVTSIADIRPERLDWAKNLWPDAKLYESGDALLDHETPDAIWITVPSYLHAGFIIKALKKGCHVFSEKPLCLNAKDANAILEAEKESGKKTMVGMVVRFFWQYQLLKDLVASKQYGKLKSLQMQRLSSNAFWGSDDWFNDPEKSGSVVLDLHIHDVDVLRYITGVEPEIKFITAEKYPDTGMINQITAVLRAGDTNAVIEGVWHHTKNFPFTVSYRAEFEDRILYYDNTKGDHVYWSNWNGEHGYIESNGDSNTKKKEDVGMNITEMGGYYIEDRYFLDCLLNGKENGIASFKEGAASVKICEKELEMAKKVAQ